MAAVTAAGVQVALSRWVDRLRFPNLEGAEPKDFVPLLAEDLVGLDAVRKLSEDSCNQELAQAREAMGKGAISARRYVALGLDAEAAALEVAERSGYARVAEPDSPAHRILVRLYETLKFEEHAIRALDLAFQQAMLEGIKREPAMSTAWGWAVLLGMPHKPAPKGRGARAAAIYLDPALELVSYRKLPGGIDQGFTDWCRRGPAIAIRIYGGEGGSGKSRFLQEHLRKQSGEGWRVGVLDRTTELPDLPVEAYERIFEGQTSVLVGVDYAEDRHQQLDKLFRALYRTRYGEDKPGLVRIVLLTRRVGGQWWETIRKQAGAETQDLLRDLSPESLELPCLASGKEEKEALYRDTLGALHETRLEQTGNDLSAPDLEDEHFGLPLFIQVAALDRYLGGSGQGDERELLKRLLDHERRFWRRKGMAVNDEVSFLAGVSEVMAQITLWQGIPDEDLSKLPVGWEATAPAHRLAPDTLAPVLRDIYGEEVAFGNERKSRRILPLKPDRLGEALVYESREGAGRRELLHAALGPQATPERLLSAVAVLGRLTRWYEAAEREVYWHGLFADLDRGLYEIADLLAQQLKNNPDTELAAQLASQLPRQLHALAPVTERCLEIIRKQFPAVIENEDVDRTAFLAFLSNDLAVERSFTGRREAALEAAEEAVGRYRELAAQRPEAFTVDLVTSLGALGSVLKRENDGLKEAARFFAEGVERLTPFLAQRPAVFTGLMQALVRDYIEVCQALKQEPDTQLLEPVAAIFERLGEEGSEIGLTT